MLALRARRGILTGDAIQRLRQKEMDLAVLSACETGLGVRFDGECVFTLRQAFHGAGCRNVVATLWEIPDKPSAALMGLFYRKLLIDNKTPLEALRESQLYLYHNPDKIDGLYEQFTRGRPQDIVAEAPKEEPTSQPKGAVKKAPLKSWAGFQLSGIGY